MVRSVGAKGDLKSASTEHQLLVDIPGAIAEAKDHANCQRVSFGAQRTRKRTRRVPTGGRKYSIQETIVTW
jgi:hypothetical protein